MYLSGMMIVELRVKLNIIGGYMYLDTVKQKNVRVRSIWAMGANELYFLPKIDHRSILGK